MPMRVIAKKRCRAMVEPPEKGERATLNPNLSTRLKPTLFRSGPLGGGLAIARGGLAALSRRLGLDRRPRRSGSLWRRRGAVLESGYEGKHRAADKSGRFICSCKGRALLSNAGCSTCRVR